MSVFSILILAVCGIYLILNFKHDIHMLQQNSYRVRRYFRWLRSDMSSAWRLIDVALLLLLFATNFLDTRLAALLIAVV